MKRKLILFFCLIIYLIIAFGTEILYREKLYEKSVEYIKKIDQGGNFAHYFYYFWSMIFLYLLMIMGILIPLFFFPINVYFIYMSILIIIIFIMCILKSLYSNPRPYWDIFLERQNNSTEVINPFPTECDGEFGNPSGHSLISTYILVLWDLFVNSNFFNNLSSKKKIFLKYITLFFSILSIIFTAYSRINRQIHSFNQIIFGIILGIAIFFLFCYIFEINKKETKECLNDLSKLKFILIPLFIILFIISALLGLLKHNENEEKYIPILEMYCHYDKEQLFGKNTAFQSSLIFAVIGSYCGILFLKYKIEKNYPNQYHIFYNWNQGKVIDTLIIAFFSFFFPFLINSVFLFIPFRYYLLKFILAVLFYFIYGFLSFGVLFYFLCLKVKRKEFSNEILIENKDNEENN